MKNEKVERLVASLHDKEEYVKYIRNLKQAVNHRLILKKSALNSLNPKKKRGQNNILI